MRAPLVAALVAAVALAGCTESTPQADCTDDVLITENVNVRLETTMGNITLELFADKVPTTASNFAALARDGEFDGSPFHRIISDFMVQGGDYTQGNGRGGAAHPACDPDGDGNIVDEYHPDLKHDAKGIISMANTGQVNSGGSQFFITFGPTPHLDAYENGQQKPCGEINPQTGRPYSCHAVFGKMVDGMDVLDRINQEAASQNGTPQTPVTLERAVVLE